jgi:RNA-directed DNA polymerase
VTSVADLASGLAAAFLAGEWAIDQLEARACTALGARPRWLPALCRRVLGRLPQPPAEVRTLARELEGDDNLRKALRRSRRTWRIRSWFLPEARMAAVSGPPARWPVPALVSPGALAAAHGLEPAELAWFADVQRRNVARADPPLRHYHYGWVRKRSSGYRLLETPKPRLKRIQRTVLRELLSAIPPDDAAHGFVPTRSVLSFVAAHVGQRVVLRLDLENFFAAIALRRVRALFARVGYPSAVADALAGLCCAATPEVVLRANPETDPVERQRTAQRLRCSHLPQGSPTSPALSNLIAFRLDRRLAGLARAAGGRYSRYADDLAFSGDGGFERGLPRFIARACAIADDEGFRVRFRKIRVLRAGRQQRLCGLVVNARPNVARRDYDALRATLHNAARLGPDSQNRQGHPDFRAHLSGRVDWIAHVHPQRGLRLRALFDRITWLHAAAQD